MVNSKKAIHSKEVDLNFIKIEKFSSFDKVLRVTTYFLRFIAKLKNFFSREKINLHKDLR